MKLAGHGHGFPLNRCAWLLLLALPAQTGAQAAPATNPNLLHYSARVWQTDDGLPQSSVYAIAQTADGYLWVGTREGLARFDGVRFTPIATDSIPELKAGWITALHGAHDGSLWVAMDGAGIARLQNGIWSHFTETNGLPSNRTQCLLETADGSIWIGSKGGLTHFAKGTFSTLTEKDGLGHRDVRALWQDHLGILRIATRQGLSSLTPEGAITNTSSFGMRFIGNVLRAIGEDSKGRLWIGSTEGLFCQDGDRRISYGAGEGLPDQTINAICKDRSGQLWIGTYFGLVRVLDGKLFSGSMGDAAFGDLVWTIFEDREDNLWVGAQNGLYRLNPARFTTFTTEQGLSRNNVMSVCEDQAGTIWAATWGGGLNALRDGIFTAYVNSNALPRDALLALEDGRDGTLWLGLELPPGGLERFQDGRRIPLPWRPGMINDQVRVLHEDRHGNLWIGTSSGLNEMTRAGKIETFTTRNGLANDVVQAIWEDAAGDLWFGTEGGLSRRRAGKFTSFTTANGLSQNSVTAIYEDSSHTLWLGTERGGLDRFDGHTFTSYTTRQGLFSDEIYEIIEDDYGYFWMSCRRGIFRVAKKDLDDFDRGELKRIACTAFGKGDGLLSVQCNGRAKPAAWKGADGKLWFPTIRGLVAVESSLPLNDREPPVRIEEVLADRKQVQGCRAIAEEAGTGEPGPKAPAIDIPPGRGELEIHFTALSFQAPEKNRFRYMLEGQDSDWLDAGPQRVARYNKVAPGRYRFRVIACNNDGVWNETGASLALVLLPHFWQTWWFEAALAAAFGLALTLAYRIRVARLRELEHLRVEIAANLHDDVGARLTKAGMIAELMDRETPPGDRNKPHIQAVFKTTREIIRAMDEIVWTINPRNDTLEHLANYVFQYAQEYFQDTGVRCRVDFPAELPEVSISTETRHNLFMTVKEALNNVLKHAAASEVRIRLEIADARLLLTIADNGCGFTPEQTGSRGNGLANMRRRMQQLGGALSLESKPGEGTSIRIEARA